MDTAMQSPVSRRAVVVGAGIGGLAAAVELAGRGLEVEILERGSAPGGKLRQVEIGGWRLDAGPTVLTMRWVLEELFDRAGVRLADRLKLRPAETLARHVWTDGSRLDLFGDRKRSADAIAAFAGPAEGRAYLEFCAEARKTYETLERTFIRAQRPSPAGLAARVGMASPGGLLRIRPFGTLWESLSRRFRDQRLRQLFGRYATYAGSSPFLAPATLSLIAHVEREGVWLAEGGMHQVARATADLAGGLGARLRLGQEVKEILVEGGRARGVRLSDGECIQAGIVVFNGDTSALAQGLLGGAARPAVPQLDRSGRSLSALTWTLVAAAGGFPLIRHNVFFCRDYAAEFEDIFRAGRHPSEPTVYVCAQDRDDRGAWPPGKLERLLVLINAPPIGDLGPLPVGEVERCTRQTFSMLSRCGLELERSPDLTRVATALDFARLFPGTGGALYGPAAHHWKASFARPGSRSALPGLYLAGGSVHPGAGVPMAALSGRLAAWSILEDLGST
jgi:1-hydroxycarotenoid 3,4-desaturase